MVAWLNGKKTYILISLAVIAALVEFIAKGDLSLGAWLTFINGTAVAGAIATFRAAFAAKESAK